MDFLFGLNISSRAVVIFFDIFISLMEQENAKRMKQPPATDFSVPFELPLTLLSRMVSEELQKGGTVEGLSPIRVLFSGSDGVLEGRVSFRESVASDVNFRMRPEFDNINQAVRCSDLEFEASGGSLFGKAATWLARQFFQSRIEAVLEKLMTEQYRALRNEALGHMKSMPLPMGLSLNTEIMDIRLTDLTVRNGALYCLIHLKASFSVTGSSQEKEETNRNNTE